MTPEQLVQHVTTAFESGDFEPLMGHLDENIVWKSASRVPGRFRFGGTYHGKAGVLEVTSQIAMSVTFLRFKLLEMVSRDDVVWCLFDTEVAARSSSRTFAYDTAARFRVREGRILEFQSFFDTAGMQAKFDAPATL